MNAIGAACPNSQSLGWGSEPWRTSPAHHRAGVSGKSGHQGPADAADSSRRYFRSPCTAFLACQRDKSASDHVWLPPASSRDCPPQGLTVKGAPTPSSPFQPHTVAGCWVLDPFQPGARITRLLYLQLKRQMSLAYLPLSAPLVYALLSPL